MHLVFEMRKGGLVVDLSSSVLVVFGLVVGRRGIRLCGLGWMRPP